MLDPKRPLKTRDGRKVKLLTTDGPNPIHKWVAVIECSRNIFQYSKDGVLYHDRTRSDLSPWTLVQERPKTTVYLCRGKVTGAVKVRLEPPSEAGYTLLGTAVIEHD